HSVHPLRCAPLELLREERFGRSIRRPDALHPALARDRASGEQWKHPRSDRGVIGDHLTLGGPRLRIEHFVEIGETHTAAADVDDLRTGRHDERVTATPWHSNAPAVCTGHMRSIWKGALTFGLVNVP